MREWNVKKDCGNGKGSDKFENSSRSRVMTPNGKTYRHIFSIKSGCELTFFIFHMRISRKLYVKEAFLKTKLSFQFLLNDN